MKERQNSSESPSSSITATSTEDDLSFSNDRLTPIDILTVDKHSRLTLTKNVKKIISLSPDNRIAVYQDAYNKNLVLKIQQQEKVVDSWVLIRDKKDKPKSNNKVNNIKKTAATDISNNNNNKGNNTLYSVPILLVDDEPDLTMSFDLFLKSEGYSNVKTFSSSKSMLKHLLDSKSMRDYKLAILDIRMPDINGIQLYQILRVLNPSIRTMFLTALDAVDELMSIYPEIKPADILRKPLEQNRFIEAINDKVSTLGIP